MRTEYAAAISAAKLPLSLILRRPLEAVVSKDEAFAQAGPGYSTVTAVTCTQSLPSNFCTTSRLNGT
jgi:hypothetical protein